MSNKLPHLRS